MDGVGLVTVFLIGNMGGVGALIMNDDGDTTHEKIRDASPTTNGMEWSSLLSALICCS